MVKRRKDKKASLKEGKKKEGKAINKVLCKDKFSNFICRAPSLRTGKKTSSFKSPNFVVPSSAAQDPGIKGALFQEDCCHDLGLAGSIDSEFQISSAEDLSLPPARQLPVLVKRVAGCENTSNGHGNAGVFMVSRTWRGRRHRDGVGEFSNVIGWHLEDCVTLKMVLRIMMGLATFSNVIGRLFEDCDLEDGIEGVRAGAPAVAGESRGIIGLQEVSESDSSVHISHVSNSLNSSVGVVVSACARVASALPAAAAPRSWSTVARLSDAVVAHAHASPMLCARTSGGTGGLLPVQRSTSYCLNNSWSDTVRVQGPTGTRRVKGGVSGPVEDLRPVSEVEAGVNFRPAGQVRGQVAGSLPRRQPGTGTRRVREGVVTPSLHPEVPGIQYVSPGRGLDIRQSMGWTKVCNTARSGIWVLKGNARARMLPENLDHLPVEWISRGTYETAWVTPGHDCLCSYQYGHGAAVRPQTNDAIWRGVIGLWGRVAPLLSPWCGRRELPTGVNLNRYSGPSSCIRWHSDNEPLFGPQNSPKLIVSMSLGNSVEFKVRRGRCGIPSPITLDHGDLLVMDGRTQSEYVHCTASGLQGPRVNLTFRWVAQHIASCPLAGVVGCVLPSCVQGLAEPGPRGDGGEGNKWSFFWGLVLLLLIMVSFLLVGTLISIRRGHRYSDQRPSCSVVHLPSRGRARWVGGRRWSLSRRRQTPKGSSFYFPSILFWGRRIFTLFSRVWVFPYRWVC